MARIREEVGAALTKAKEDMKRFYDRSRREAVEYKVGDKVWLEGTNISTELPMKKLGPKRWGPFEILEKIGASSYKLKIPKTWRNIHPVHNEVLLSPYHAPQFPNQITNTEPPPIVVGKEVEYEVEEILDSKKIRGTLKYKVHWKGYGKHEETWEPIANLGNAKELVEEFHKKYPSKPRPAKLKRLEIPITNFPLNLLRPIPEPITEATPSTLPTAALVNRAVSQQKS